MGGRFVRFQFGFREFKLGLEFIILQPIHGGVILVKLGWLVMRRLELCHRPPPGEHWGC